MNEQIRGYLNRNYIFAVLAASLASGFQHGYQLGAMNVPEKIIREWVLEQKIKRQGTTLSEEVTRNTWSIAVSAFALGGIFGSLMTTHFTSKFGSKRGLLWNNVIMFLGILFMSCAKEAESYECLIIGRFLMGVNAGLNSGICPIYLIEIAPPKIRGATGTFYQFTIAIFLLFSEAMGLKDIFGTENLWPLIFGISVIPSLFQLVALSYCPESPRHLLCTEEDEVKAEEALIWFRKNPDVKNELQLLKDMLLLVRQLPVPSLKAMFMNPLYRSPWILCVVGQLGQQFCGVNAIIYYSYDLYIYAGATHTVAQYSTVITGFIFVLVTAFFLVGIEVIGRRAMLLISFSGMAFDCIFLTIALKLSQDDDVRVYMGYCTIFNVILFTVFFGCGAGSVPWIMTAEYFNHFARGLAITLTIPVNWLANFLFTQTFADMQVAMGYNVFVIYTILDFSFFFFFYCYLPETKGKTVGQIIAYFYEIDDDVKK